VDKVERLPIVQVTDMATSQSAVTVQWESDITIVQFENKQREPRGQYVSSMLGKVFAQRFVATLNQGAHRLLHGAAVEIITLLAARNFVTVVPHLSSVG